MNLKSIFLVWATTCMVQVLLHGQLTAPELTQGYALTYGVANTQPQGWDWGGQMSLQNVAIDVVPIDSTAYAPLFPNASFAQVNSVNDPPTYSMYDFSNGGFDFWGVFDANAFIPFTEALTLVPFPFFVNETHQDSISVLFTLQGVQIHRKQKIVSEALEWDTLWLPGDLVLPEVLKINWGLTVRDSTSTSDATLIVDGDAYWAQDLPLPVAQTYTYTEVVDGDSNIVYVGSEFLLDAVANVSERLLPAVALTCYPNPANDIVSIATEPGTWVEARDASGRQVNRFQQLSEVEELDIAAWPVGLYFVSNGFTTQRVMVLH